MLKERLEEQTMHIETVKKSFCNKLDIPISNPLPSFENIMGSLSGILKVGSKTLTTAAWSTGVEAVANSLVLKLNTYINNHHLVIILNNRKATSTNNLCIIDLTLDTYQESTLTTYGSPDLVWIKGEVISAWVDKASGAWNVYATYHPIISMA